MLKVYGVNTNEQMFSMPFLLRTWWETWWTGTLPRTEKASMVKCGGGMDADVGCWLSLGRKLAWAKEEKNQTNKKGKKPSRKSRWNQLQNSLRKWNSKKPRAIVQNCGFLSKYDSPCAGKRKGEDFGKWKGSWWEMMCSEGYSQDTLGGGGVDVTWVSLGGGWLPSSLLTLLFPKAALGPMWSRSFEAPKEKPVQWPSAAHFPIY